MVNSSDPVIQELSGKIKNLISEKEVIEVINNIDEITNDGIYLIKSIPAMQGLVDTTINQTAVISVSNCVFNDPSITIDWGDGIIETVTPPEYYSYSHTYNEPGQYIVKINGDISTIGAYFFAQGFLSVDINEVAILGPGCFDGNGAITSINMSSNVIKLSQGCFQGCTGLTSLAIPASITQIDNGCFAGCNNLINCQLYWEDSNIISYSPDVYYNISPTFIIPQGQTNNYINKGYPSNQLQERGE